jgi:gas vesicle protein
MSFVVPDGAPWWWDSASTVAAAIVGALIGAVPAFLLAKKSAKEILRRDAAKRAMDERGLTQRLVVKLLAIIDALGDLKRHIDEEFSKEGTAERSSFEPWQLVLPMAGQRVEDVPRFTSDELTVLFSEGEYELMQELMLFQRRCASSYVSFQEFCDRRAALETVMPAPISWDGNMARTLLTEEQANRLKQHTIPLNSLILSLRDHLTEDMALALSVAEKVTAFARIKLNQPKLTISAKREDQ